MRHLSDGMLAGYRDDHLPEDERRAVENHVRMCRACQERLNRLVADGDHVSRLLGALGPGVLDRSDSDRALVELRINIKGRQKIPMLQKIKTDKRYQRALAGIFALLVLVGLFSLAPVRALASDFLSLFRVQKFVVVDVDEERIEEIAEVLAEDYYFGEQEILEDPGEPVAVDTLDEAEALVGFGPRTPGKYGTPKMIAVVGQSRMRFTPNVEALREVFVALGLDPALLPDNIDGQPFDFTVPASVTQLFNRPDQSEVDFVVMQVPSPTAEVPEGVDMQALGEAMLQLLGMSPEEAANLSESIDWATTLVLPVPTGMLQTMQEVEVDGVTGLLFEMEGRSEDGAYLKPRALLWQKDDIVYMITSNYGDVHRLLDIGNSLK